LIGSSAYSERACRAIYPATTDFALVIRTLYDVARSRFLGEAYAVMTFEGYGYCCLEVEMVGVTFELVSGYWGWEI
jgi:hypothetical protein